MERSSNEKKRYSYIKYVPDLLIPGGFGNPGACFFIAIDVGGGGGMAFVFFIAVAAAIGGGSGGPVNYC